MAQSLHEIKSLIETSDPVSPIETKGNDLEQEVVKYAPKETNTTWDDAGQDTFFRQPWRKS